MRCRNDIVEGERDVKPREWHYIYKWATALDICVHVHKWPFATLSFHSATKTRTLHSSSPWFYLPLLYFPCRADHASKAFSTSPFCSQASTSSSAGAPWLLMTQSRWTECGARYARPRNAKWPLLQRSSRCRGSDLLWLSIHLWEACC
jgi:hypothetical protein